jgi:predicted aldo/keto reductase-like oxidoreductase|tara:strand:+ start:174 stop:371 length:198 start_codon:yes stop_codon:yes gene_type:complete
MTTKLNEEEREKENLVKEIERALHALVNSSTDVCPLPMPTPEEIESRNKSLKNIADEYLKKTETK